MSHTRFFGELAADVRGEDDDRPPVVLLHGLSFDRSHWSPALRALAAIDPGRRTVAFDLPGHGESPRRDSYRLDELADVLHEAITAAGLREPVIVGHSLAGVLATVYAARYPARAVVNVDQPLLVGGFQDLLRAAEALLRGLDYGRLWYGLLAGMGVEKLPAEARALVNAAALPAQDLLLGYWDEVLNLPAEEIAAERERDLARIRERGAAYHHVSGGGHDTGYQAWLLHAMPEATISVIVGGGHFPHLACPADVAEIIASYG